MLILFYLSTKCFALFPTIWKMLWTLTENRTKYGNKIFWKRHLIKLGRIDVFILNAHHSTVNREYYRLQSFVYANYFCLWTYFISTSHHVAHWITFWKCSFSSFILLTQQMLEYELKIYVVNRSKHEGPGVCVCVTFVDINLQDFPLSVSHQIAYYF